MNASFILDKNLPDLHRDLQGVVFAQVNHSRTDSDCVLVTISHRANTFYVDLISNRLSLCSVV